MARRKTNEEFTEEVYNLVGGEYTLLEKYITSKTKIKVRHNTCGYEWRIQPNEFLRGVRCPECFLRRQKNRGKRKKKTNKEFKNETHSLVGDEYEFLDDYVNYETHLKIKHNVCNNIYETTPSIFFQGRRCPYCSPFANKTTESFYQEVNNLGKGNYTLIGEYINDSEKVKINHNICGQTYKVKPTNFIQGQRCPNCRYKKVSLKTRKTQEQFEEEVYEVGNGEYNTLSKYEGYHKKVMFKHLDCGNKYLTTPNTFFSGSRCPRCYESKGENAISSYLEKNKYIFLSEYTFSDLKAESGKHLRFDFALLDKKENIVGLIEYDGEQHFEPVSFWGGKESLLDLQVRDNLKNEYCKENNLPLLRIPYWEFDNIELHVEFFMNELFTKQEVVK